MAVKSITLMWPSFELTLTTVPGPAGSDQPSPIFSSWRPAMSRSHYRWRGQAGFNEWFRWLARYARRFLVIDIIGFGRSVTGLLVSGVITFGSGEFNRSCLYRGSFIRSALINFGGSLCKRKSVAWLANHCRWPLAEFWTEIW